MLSGGSRSSHRFCAGAARVFVMYAKVRELCHIVRAVSLQRGTRTLCPLEREVCVKRTCLKVTQSILENPRKRQRG